MKRTLTMALTSLVLSLVLHSTFNSVHAAPARADWEKIPSTDFTLPDPPDAQESKREIDVLLKLQSERTQEECTLGEQQEQPSFKALFKDSPLLTEHEYDTLKPLMKRVSQLGDRISTYFKERYHRTRPYNFDTRVQPCVTPPGGAKSYPSSHAMISTLDSCVLAAIFPSYANDFETLGRELSERRMKIGVHFPSDVQAGKNLAAAVCQRLLQEPDFAKELKDTKSAL